MGPWAAYLIDNFTPFRWQDPLLNLTLGGHCSGTNLGCILYFMGPTRFFETMIDNFLKKIQTIGFDSDGRSFHQNSRDDESWNNQSNSITLTFSKFTNVFHYDLTLKTVLLRGSNMQVFLLYYLPTGTTLL